MAIDPTKKYTATFTTSRGEIVCELLAKDAPKTVNNFVFLANEKFYDGTIFHRVIADFMVQGGDPTGTGRGGPGYKFEDETKGSPHKHAPGTLSMANAGPNTNGSQFFITEQAYESLNQHYTLFGQCDDASVDVVKSIARVQRDGNDKPLMPVILRKVTIVREGQPLPPSPTAVPAAPSVQSALPAAPKP